MTNCSLQCLETLKQWCPCFHEFHIWGEFLERHISISCELQWLVHQYLEESKMKLPSHLNRDGIIVSEMNPWTKNITLILPIYQLVENVTATHLREPLILTASDMFCSRPQSAVCQAIIQVRSLADYRKHWDGKEMKMSPIPVKIIVPDSAIFQIDETLASLVTNNRIIGVYRIISVYNLIVIALLLMYAV